MIFRCLNYKKSWFSGALTALYCDMAPCSLSFSGSGSRSGSSFKMNNFWTDFPLSVQENLIFVYIDMVNVVLDLNRIRLKYMLETIKYNKVDFLWAQLFITVATIKFTFSFIKKLRIPITLVWSTYLIKYQQSIVK